MTNPAARLALIFDDWRQDTQTNTQIRGMKEGADGAAREHLLAMENLIGVRAAIDELEQEGRDVERYRRMLTKWTFAVITYPHGWDKQGAGPRLVNAHAWDVLNDLADAIRYTRPPILKDQLAPLVGLLDGIDDLNDTDESVPAELREYIHRLTQHARNCIDDYEVLGKFELHHALEQLWVALQAAEARASDETKSRWREWWGKIHIPATAGLLGNAPTLAVAVAALTQSGG